MTDQSAGNHSAQASNVDATLVLQQNEAELLEQLQAVSESAEAILLLDLDRQIVAMNEEAENLYGRQAEQLIGKSFDTVVMTVHQGSPNQLFGRCVQGKRVRNVAAIRRMARGNTLPIALTLSLLADTDGRPIGIAAIARDVVELRQQVAREARLITLRELTAGLAHELNQPLSAISHYCDAALCVASSAAEPDAELVDTLREAYGQAQRAGEILRNLRNMVTTTEYSRSEENLNALVEETTRFLVPEFRINDVTVNLSLTSGIPPLLIDRVQIQQVIVNILLNSIEAMSAATSETRQVSITTTYDDKEVQVDISDTGPGIPAEMRESLYDAFETNKTDGLGLGLSICKSIVLAHQGRIWSDPWSSSGATFHFTLPRGPE